MPANPTDETRHRPRILCLHGGGTNARIFRAQCRVLHGLLSPHFRLCFAEGPFPCTPGTDVVSVYRDFGAFKSWIPQPPDPIVPPEIIADRILGALHRTMEEDDRSGADGKWLAVLGFSQGARLAASLLLQHQLGGTGRDEDEVDFRFAVLIAGRGPIIPLGLGLGLGLGADPTGTSIAALSLSLPTIHIHGLQDPGLTYHRELLERYCDPQTAEVVEWQGDHRVPIKLKDARRVVDAVLRVARQTGCLSWDA
ncbi:hypothetical protein BO71DRAFT_395217 [Aspergillus ellipticus CBS 707.79]|uniref:Serine hydrolase domain-containing protein n=1 Tax=Aspergillus ellipticus CBS 707.79 TaxID=1448320 RepID=A0A319ECC1_9EURO|nr:hypothetical protein BO71DRAFT_395217 [Aspergillus ellipticus CBS 707.79]